MKIGIIVAMNKEHELLSSLFATENIRPNGSATNLHIGKYGNHDVCIIACGIGKVNAAVRTVEMIREFGPDLIISTGCAGSMSAALSVGDFILANECMYHDVWCGKPNEPGQIQGMPAKFLCHSKATRILMETIREAGLPHCVGTLISGDRFADYSDVASLSYYNAQAVDMESAAIAQTSHLFKVPFVAFRIISDVVIRPGNAEGYENFWKDAPEESFNILVQFLKNLEELWIS